MNPDGYEHTPFSKEGGIIFVKLRQYPGDDRSQIVVETQNKEWIESVPGISIKMLYSEHGYPEEMSLQNGIVELLPVQSLIRMELRY